ncbi:MAG: IS1 family transposase [Thermoanaerobaculia bacterium]
MNKLSDEKRGQILMSLVEGNSIAATCRMTGAAKMTVLSLIREVGSACVRFHDAQVRHLLTERVQCDEIWSFCYSKQKNVPASYQGVTGYGSIWTWTALDADSKLLISWQVSDRNQEAADALIRDLKSRTMMRLQISTDGLPDYFNAIYKNFAYGEADHAEVVKVYASSKPVPGTTPKSAASRYSPGRLQRVDRIPKFGMPITKHISTSFMERWNLTLRMQNRRFTRLTNGFSKKLENHCYMLAITMVYYNFCRRHASLKGKTPAMAAGITKTAWKARDLLALDMWANEASAA